MAKDMIRETTDDFIGHNKIKITSVEMYFEIYHKFQSGKKPNPDDYKETIKAVKDLKNASTT